MFAVVLVVRCCFSDVLDCCVFRLVYIVCWWFAVVVLVGFALRYVYCLKVAGVY